MMKLQVKVQDEVKEEFKEKVKMSFRGLTRDSFAGRYLIY